MTANLIDLSLGHYDLPFEVILKKDYRTLLACPTRKEAEAFVQASDYVKVGEHRANENLPGTFFGETIKALEQDVIIVTVEYADAERNLSVNEKVQALLAKKGEPARSSSENKFRKALEQLVTDWQAESLEENGPKWADFKDTRVVGTIGTYHGTHTGVGLTFDGSGYDYLSCQNEFEIESYREALQALCDLHGWFFEDHTTWAISFHRN